MKTNRYDRIQYVRACMKAVRNYLDYHSKRLNTDEYILYLIRLAEMRLSDLKIELLKIYQERD